MDVGLLWYDGGKKQLADKVAKAVKRYRERFGERPNVCYVHPLTLPEGEQEVAGVTVRTSPQILQHHFWVGREERTPERA